MKVSCVGYIVYMRCEYSSSFQLLLSIPRRYDCLYVPTTTVRVHMYIIVCNCLFSAVQIPRYLVDLDSPIAIVYCVRLIYVLDVFCGGWCCVPTLYHETYTCTHGHVCTSTCTRVACISVLLMLLALLIGLHFPVRAWSMMVKAIHVITTVIVWILVWYCFVIFIICIRNNNYFRMEVVTTSMPFDPVLFPHQREGGICTEGMLVHYSSSMLRETLPDTGNLSWLYIG